MDIRRATAADHAAMNALINAAAQAYRGVIPADCWHEPYMTMDEMRAGIAEGIEFWLAEDNGGIAGVMGIQDKGPVALVRHAYVAPDAQRRGTGTALLRHLEALAGTPVLIGTWADAHWAIGFYLRNGYRLLPAAEKDALLQRFWNIPARQVETSVVLADRRWPEGGRAVPTNGERRNM